MSFWLHGCCGEWEGGPVNQVNHTSLVTVVTPTDRPKSVRNCCLIELFCGVVCVVTLSFWHFCLCRGFCHRTGSDLLLFVLIQRNRFYSCECKRGLCRLSRITVFIKIDLHTRIVQSTRWTGALRLFPVIRTIIMFSRTDRARGKCAYTDIPLMQNSCHKLGHMKFSSHHEMRRDATKWCPSF